MSIAPANLPGPVGRMSGILLPLPGLPLQPKCFSPMIRGSDGKDAMPLLPFKVPCISLKRCPPNPYSTDPDYRRRVAFHYTDRSAWRETR